MRRHFFYFLSLFILLQPLIAAAQDQAQLISEANQFFRQATATGGEEAKSLYQKALLRFRNVVDSGTENGKLYYNIANTYWRLGNIGQAIVNYRRAEQFMPEDANLKHNLNYVLSQRRDKIELKEKEKVLHTLFFWHYDIPSSVRILLFAVAWAALWFLLLIRIWRKGPVWPIVTSFCCSFLLLGSLAIDHYTLAGHPRGVIIGDEIIARKGDALTYQPSFKEPLHAGTEFRVMEKRNDWLQIELANTSRTWIPAASAELL